MRVTFSPFRQSESKIDHTFVDSILKSMNFHSWGLELIEGNSISEPSTEFFDIDFEVFASS